MKYLDECRLFGNVTATNNLVSMEDVILQSLESDWSGVTLANLDAMRQNFAAILLNAAGLMAPGLLTYGKFLAIPEQNIQLILDKLYQHFIDNSLSVNSRGFTFGSPAADVGNVGTGVIRRLNVDENNFPIEAQHVEAKRAKCVLDESSGASPHEEVFQFEGAFGGKDALEFESGSGAIRRIQALSARQSLLLNPSFSDFSGTAALPTDITNWTSSTAVIGDGTDYTIESAAGSFYRGYEGDPGPRALNIKLTRTLSQTLALRGTDLDPDVPYLLQVAYNRQVGGATGDLVIEMGNKTTTVALAAQAGWNLALVPSAVGTNCWLRNFNEADIDVKITFTRTAGALLVDDVLLVPATGFDGSWYWVIGGATKFALDDLFTWTDTATEAKIQRWLWRGYARYLPSNNAGAETWADPA